MKLKKDNDTYTIFQNNPDVRILLRTHRIYSIAFYATRKNGKGWWLEPGDKHNQLNRNINPQQILTYGNIRIHNGRHHDSDCPD